MSVCNKNFCTQRSDCVSNRLVVVRRKCLTSQNDNHLPTLLGYIGYIRIYMVSQAMEDAHNLFRDDKSDESLFEATQTTVAIARLAT